MPVTPKVAGGPDFAFEHQAWSGGASVVAGMDEVGRGSLAGPVGVGVVSLHKEHTDAPERLHDSKKLTPSARIRLVPLIAAWALESAVGYASAAEIDDVGLSAALRLAGQRALAGLRHQPDAVLLDGRDNWLAGEVPVTMVVKGDQTCVSIAAASIVAKVARDAVMVELDQEFPHYAWARNKGYASATHRMALQQHGVSPHHRVSWKLPGTESLQEPLPL